MKYIKKALLFIPIIAFVFISVAFYLALKSNSLDELPSALIKKSAPKIELMQLGDKELPLNEDFGSPEIKFVNFWASWCAPCRAEHPMLEQISKLGYPIIGINYKDEPQNALQFLEALGDPYSKVGSDLSGRAGIEWGLYGVPETFVIDKNGQIIFRHAGPITSTNFNKKFLPLLTKKP
jgi:cytochrome c biogenesis protein CcmG/thiol:disulfide interchange protein DsbE